jgi:hypothetical protein
VKTKAWTRDTTNSRQNSDTCLRKEGKNDSMEDARIRRRWPAVIFALSRTLKVIGRIKFLKLSMKTIKEIK